MCMPISVVIITYNEAHNLPRTLSKLHWCDDIVIVDSGSTDGTEQIAIKAGARFYTHAFEGYGAQKNYGFGLTTHDWILSIDADEVLSDALIDELLALDLKTTAAVGFRIPIRNVFLNREFKFGKESNYKHLRLFRKDKGHYDHADVHEQLIVEGAVSDMKHHILHYSYRGVAHYLEKMEDYTNRGAAKLYKKGKRRPLLLVYLLAPFYFLKHYVLYGNILNGKAGFIWSVLNARYHTVKYLKLYQLHQQDQSHS